MNTKEKILLVQLLLEDIRENCNRNRIGRDAEDRALKVKSLCEELAKETDNDEYIILADYCSVYVDSSRRWKDWDGRFFRQPFPMGYEKMDKMHGLKPTYNNKSKDFQTVAKEYITCPELRFTDWETQL